MEKFLTFATQLAGPFILFTLVYLFAILPRRRKLKAHQRMIEGLKPNDRVITIAGIRGRLVGRNKDLFLIEVAPEVRFEIEGSTIESVIEGGQTPVSGRAPQRAPGTAQPSHSGRHQEPVRGNQGETPHGKAGNRPPSPRPKRCACGADLGGGDRFCGECGREVK